MRLQKSKWFVDCLFSNLAWTSKIKSIGIPEKLKTYIKTISPIKCLARFNKVLSKFSI